MEEKKEFSAKTVDEAIQIGLKELGITEDQAEIEVLEEGKKKLFSSVKARVLIGKKEEEVTLSDGERAVEFLKGLFEIMDVKAETTLTSEGEKIEINVNAENTSSLIGKRGSVLDAVQTLAGAVANIGRDDYKRVVVDCENYRENREETLKKLAENLANKAVRIERKIKLEAMNPYERRIIHATLAESETVKTESEGKEPNRYVVIVPNNEKDPTLPAVPARDDNRRRGGYNGKKNFGKKPYSKPYNQSRRERSGGQRSSYGKSAPKKSSTDFFGTFLGNSKDN